MSKNTFINLESIQFFVDREISMCMLLTGISFSFIIFKVFILSFNAGMMFLGIIFLIPLIFMVKFFFNVLNKPSLTLTENYICSFNKKIKLYYSDIYSVSIKKNYKGKELLFKMKNIEKYSKDDTISFRLMNIGINDNELIDILNKKITNINLKIIGLYKDYEARSQINKISLGSIVFNIVLILFFLIYIGYSFYNNELVLASRNSVTVLTGISMYIVIFSLVVFITRLLILVLEYHNQKDTRIDFEKYKIPLTSISLILFFIGAFFELIKFQ